MQIEAIVVWWQVLVGYVADDGTGLTPTIVTSRMTEHWLPLLFKVI